MGEYYMTKKQKFYAVKKGRNLGIFDNWSDCTASITGFQGAEYEAFLSKEEAQAYLNGEDFIFKTIIKPLLDENKTVAFVDGSYNENKQAYGSGVFIISPDGHETSLSQKGNNKALIELRNVAGEIIAVYAALDWAISNQVESITIFYDYEGIEKWANGSWKAKNNLTSRYKEVIDERKDILNIEFCKVKGHSNNKYNDIVDSLAKGAIENKIFNNYGANGYEVNATEDQIDNLVNELKLQYQGLNFQKIDPQYNKVMWKLTLNKDNLNLSLYKHSKLVVQGKLTNLFQLFTSCLIESIDCGDFTQILKDAYRIKINRSDVNEKLKKALPNIKTQLSDNMQIILQQTMIDLENYASNDIEFTKYTFNAFRALDGALKIMLFRNNIPLSKKHTYDMFDLDKSQNKHVLKAKWIKQTATNDVQGIEECYNYFYNNRHTLSHFGIIMFNTNNDNTRFINTKKDANDIITQVLSLINRYL